MRARSWRVRRMAALGVVMLMAAGCVDPFLAPEPDTDPHAIFDLVWHEIDTYYAGFTVRPDLDWDAIRAEYRPQVSADMSDQALAALLGAMIAELEDGHADLTTPHGVFGFDPFAGHPANYEPGLVAANYLTDQAMIAGIYEAGFLEPDIGYVHIASMAQGESTGPAIERVLDHLDGARGLVVDVRSNIGGSDDVSEAIAARFADRSRAYRYLRYKAGPGHADLTPPIADFIDPVDRTYQGGVAVLTNRRTYDAAEGFVLGMRVFPNIITVGDTTAGGAGDPVWRELPNGWVYRVPRWLVFTAEGRPYEGTGLIPTVTVGDITAELAAGTDPIVETAIAELRKRIGG